MAQKITPNLWFDGDAAEAAEFYTTAFPDSVIHDTTRYPASSAEGLADFQADLAGKVLTVDFTVGGLRFTGINAGADFTPNPSISFFVHFNPAKDEQAVAHLDELWGKLAEGGEVMMPLDSYPFSQHYGWVTDRFGISWQLMLVDAASEPRPFIVPALMFTREHTNQAEAAITAYTSLFDDSKTATMARYLEQTGPAKAGSLMYADFTLAGQWFVAMDSGAEHAFTFNEGISLSISCKDQAEIDYFWDKLSHVPEAEQCGWCKDQFGVSWQIVPANMGELMQKPDAFTHMMGMKKLVIDEF